MALDTFAIRDHGRKMTVRVADCDPRLVAMVRLIEGHLPPEHHLLITGRYESDLGAGKEEYNLLVAVVGTERSLFTLGFSRPSNVPLIEYQVFLNTKKRMVGDHTFCSIGGLREVAIALNSELAKLGFHILLR